MIWKGSELRAGCSHTHTHTQSEGYYTLSRLLCPPGRRVCSHMLPAWTDTFPSTCPASIMFFPSRFALLPCSGLLQQAAWVRKKETSSGRRQTTFILASHFSTTRSVNNLDPAESLIKRLLSAPIATFGWLKLLLLSQGVPHRGKDSNDGERYHQLQLTSSSSIWFHLQ